MNLGELVRLKHPTWLRADPATGGSVGLYQQGTLFVIVEPLSEELTHCKVLTADGKVGWLFKEKLESVV